MKSLAHLLQANKKWSETMLASDPDFFRHLSKQQAPKYFWIGCSDSRVPANQIMGLAPGEVFVHRNVANAVVHADLNCLSAMQFAVDVLKVEHIIVCGHYGCSGVQAALEGRRVGLADNWLRHVHDVALKHDAALQRIDTASMRHAKLCELNVLEQVVNICHSTVMRDAWDRGQEVNVHGWIYGLHDGRLRDLHASADSMPALLESYQKACAELTRLET
jgi:carbonic anhydrase